MPKNWCFWAVCWRRLFRVPWTAVRSNQSVHPKGDWSRVFIGGTDVEAETPILWPPDVKSWLIWKDPDAGKDWGQEEKGMTEGEMVGWHHWHNRYGFGWTLGIGDGQGGLACCGSWACKESDMTEWLNWTEKCIRMSRHISWFTGLAYLVVGRSLTTDGAFVYFAVPELYGVHDYSTSISSLWCLKVCVNTVAT